MRAVQTAFVVGAVGSVLGAIGWLTNLPWIFWSGIALCAVALALDLAAGAAKLAVLAAFVMAVTAFLFPPWYVGLAMGLLICTATADVARIAELRKAKGQQPSS